ncbi:MAG: NAD(P)-dependent oxidoreductase [Rhodospirillales bacterium]|nr:NAD(P)-dependent oxidoreductase [Rhodospirillales bacterium]
MTTVALIGAGAMGGAIGARLLASGSALRVFDPDPEKRAALADHGAVCCENARLAATGADAVILSLNSPGIVRAAVFGPAGVAEGAGSGMLIIDMSSIDPEATRAYTPG